MPLAAASDLDSAKFDSNARQILAAGFGSDLYNWPPIPRARPRFWQRQALRDERRILTAERLLNVNRISDGMRAVLGTGGRRAGL